MRVVQAYVTSMVGSVDVIAQDQSLDDPLEDGAYHTQSVALPFLLVVLLKVCVYLVHLPGRVSVSVFGRTGPVLTEFE